MCVILESIWLFFTNQRTRYMDEIFNENRPIKSGSRARWFQFLAMSLAEQSINVSFENYPPTRQQFKTFMAYIHYLATSCNIAKNNDVYLLSLRTFQCLWVSAVVWPRKEDWFSSINRINCLAPYKPTRRWCSMCPHV